MHDVPPEMTAIEITEPGGPEVLRATRRTVPDPAAGEVLIQVEAAGVNRPDVMQRRGQYPPPPGASDIPGLEIAGTIVRVGPSVTRWRIGDRAVESEATSNPLAHLPVSNPATAPIVASNALSVSN